MWDTNTNYNVIALYLLDIECDCKVSASQKDVRVLTPQHYLGKWSVRSPKKLSNRCKGAYMEEEIMVFRVTKLNKLSLGEKSQRYQEDCEVLTMNLLYYLEGSVCPWRC